MSAIPIFIAMLCICQVPAKDAVVGRPFVVAKDDGLPKLAGGQSASDRYELLKNWSLPTSGRQSIRSVTTTVSERSRHAPRDEPKGESTPNSKTTLPETDGLNARSARHAERDGYVDDDPAMPLSRVSVTSTWLLVEAAREAGKLDELLAIVRPLAEKDVENAKPLLQMIQMARGQGTKWEPDFQKFIDERKAEWLKPAADASIRLRDSTADLLIAKAALNDRELHRSGITLANAIVQHSLATNSGTLLPQLRRDFGAALMSRVPGSTSVPSADPGLLHWVSGSLIRPDAVPDSAPPAWWLAHEGLVAHVSGTDQDFLYLAIPLTGQFEFSCECWAVYWGESNTGYGGLVCDTLHGSRPTLIWPAGGHEQRVTHKPQARWDDWNRVRIAVDTQRGEASWFVNDHLIYTDLEIGPTSPWVSLLAYGTWQTAFRNLRITGQPIIPREVTLSDTDRLEGWVSSFFNETQSPRRQTLPNRNPLINRLSSARQAADNAFDWSSRDGQICGRRLVPPADDEKSARPSRLYYHRPLRNGETVRYEFFYDRDAKQLVHPTLGRSAMLLEADGVRLLRMGESEDVAELARVRSIDEPNRILANSATSEANAARKTLPLKNRDWNTVTLSLSKGVCHVTLNGELIFERPFAATHDLHFGFYHDKSQTEAKIRNVVLTGDWLTSFTPDLNQALLAPREPLTPAARQSKAVVIGERYHQFSVRDVVRHARELPPAERFEFLANWVIPGDDHLSWRLFGAFTPTNPAPEFDSQLKNRSGRRVVVAGEFESPVTELIAVAKELDRLDELGRRILNAPAANVGDVLESHDVKARMALAVLISIADRNVEDADQALQELLKLAAAGPPDLPQIQRWPEFVAVMASLDEPALWTFAELLAIQVVDHNNWYHQGYWWEIRVRHLLDQVRSRQAAGIDATAADKWNRGTGVVAPKQWHPYGALTSNDRSSGLTSRWEIVGGELRHRAGMGIDLLSFQSPLRGSFEVKCEVPMIGWREKELIYATKFASPYQSSKRFATGSFWYGSRFHESDLPPIHEFYELKLVVEPGKATTFVNGGKLHEQPLDDDCDPWLVLGRLAHFSGWVRNLRITGDPIIPTEIDLLAGSDLSSWFDVYYQNPRDNERLPEGNARPRPYWERMGNTLIGSRLGKLFQDSQTETVLHYHRPLAEDGEIEYEFYFAQQGQPNAGTPIVVHPALDRLTFLLRPDGVAVHWMTDGQFDSTGVLPGNVVVEAENRRGPATLPLKDKEWNKLKLSLRGDVVTLTLNGEAVYERTLEPTNQRNFGLFRFADESEARVRNIVYRGDWPKTLPKLEDQELAANVNRLAHFEPNELPAARRWNFRGERPKWVIPMFDVTTFGSLMKATDDGLVLSLPPGRTLPGDILGFEATGHLRGDFEMTVKFQILKLERSELATSFKVPGVDIGVMLQSPTTDLLHIQRRWFEDREQGHAIQAVHRWHPTDQTFAYDNQKVPWSAMSGRMKLVRKYPRMMYLFADADLDDWQLIHQHSVTQVDAIKPIVWVRNHDSKSDVAILFQDWSLRAAKIME